MSKVIVHRPKYILDVEDALSRSPRPFISPEEQNILNYRGTFDHLLGIVRTCVSNTKDIVIAGGAVRDIAMLGEISQIKDFDIWVLNTQALNESMFCNTLGHALLSYAQEGDTPKTCGLYMPQGSNPLHPNSIVFDGFIQAISKPVQVIVTASKNVPELLSSFDIRACQFAYDGRRIYTEGAQDFLNNKLTINFEKKAITRPITTMRRAFVLANKYYPTRRMKFDRDDILTLSALELWK